MIVDTSALVAILLGEPEAALFTNIIANADVCRVSVVSRVELAMVQARLAGPDAPRQAELYMLQAGIIEEPVTLQQGVLARNAFYDFGRGRHPAKLNFGDCFAYALAKALREPLLFKGSDFAQTDVIPAYQP
ncbi:MAG: type II toxin-antitoxin system VapC family toxin [Acidobacteriota bacterium]